MRISKFFRKDIFFIGLSYLKCCLVGNSWIAYYWQEGIKTFFLCAFTVLTVATLLKSLDAV